MRPWSFASRQIVLYQNPHALFPYSGALERLPQRVVGGDSWLRTQAGLAVRELLRVGESWPE